MTRPDAATQPLPESGVGAEASSSCDAGEPQDIYATAQPFECNESLQTIPTRPGVTLPFDLVVPAGGRAPSAVVILLPGGAGQLDLSSTGIGSGADNFCVRTRQAYAAAGFVVAVPDVPSDREDAGLTDFRATSDHATDLGALVLHLRQSYASVAVWMVSTSRGTISATDALSRLAGAQAPDHVVLTSSVTYVPPGASDPEDIQSVPDYQARLATAAPLMIDDSLDQCGASPPVMGPSGSGAEVLAQSIGDEKHFVLVDGGPTPPPSKDPSAVCGGLAYHGFYGNDDLVVGEIIAFIESH